MDYLKRKTCKNEFETIESQEATIRKLTSNVNKLAAQVNQLQTEVKSKDDKIDQYYNEAFNLKTRLYESELERKKQVADMEKKVLEADVYKFLFKHLMLTTRKDALDAFLIHAFENLKISSEMIDSDVERLYNYNENYDLLGRLNVDLMTLYLIVSKMIKPKKSYNKAREACMNLYELADPYTKLQVRQKYRTLALRYHPDKVGQSPEGREKFEAARTCKDSLEMTAEDEM